MASPISQEMAHLLRAGCYHHQSGKASGSCFICQFILTFTDCDQIVCNLFFDVTKVVLLSLRRNHRQFSSLSAMIVSGGMAVFGNAGS